MQLLTQSPQLSTILPDGKEQTEVKHVNTTSTAMCMLSWTPSCSRQHHTSPGSALFFFSDFGGFSAFFSRSRKRTTMLHQVVVHRLPRASTTQGNIHNCTVNTVYGHKDDILKCFQTIRDSGNFDPPTVRAAGWFVRMLEDEAFCFLTDKTGSQIAF